MELTLEEVAGIVGGTVHGDPQHVIRGLCALDESGPAHRDHLSFLAPKAKLDRALESAVTSIMVAKTPEKPGDRNWIQVPDPNLGFALVAQRFHPLPRARETRIHPSAVVASDAELQDPVEIGPQVVVESGARIGPGSGPMAGAFVGEGSRVGSDCVLHPRVVVCHHIAIGDRVQLHPGAVIGSDGFGNAKDGARFIRIPQMGTVIIEDDAEIGANTTVDRATLGATRIRRGAKVDNLVMIAHNCDIGEDTALAGQVGMAGSTKVGNRCMLAGQVGLAGHISVGDDIVLGAKAGVIGDLTKPGFYAGLPAMPGKEFITLIAEWKRAGDTRRKVARMEKERGK